jgi:hypothetical protein
MTRWFPALAEAASESGTAGAKRHCILLWMNGGPTQTDTFDMKPGHANGGSFKEIATSSAGLRFSEHLPRLATLGEHLAVLRGLSTGEGDHGRGTYIMRTGRRPEAEIRFPTLGSFLSKELGDGDIALPNYVSVNPFLEFEPTAYDSGFLGPRFASLGVKPRTPDEAPAEFAQRGINQFANLGVDHIRPAPGVPQQSAERRLELLGDLQSNMTSNHPGGPTATHHSTLQRALRLMSSDAGKVFDLSDESAEVRAKYGPGTFGQGCLLARRLVERGVSFVEVSLGDQGRWDTHNDNFNTVQQLSTELDRGWASLMEDLRDRGLLESTTILWMGEFGRTPQINSAAGRDHYPNAWSAVLAGGGIRGGQAYGRTSADGMMVEEGMMTAADVHATLCKALRLDHRHQNMSDIGRPFRLSDGKPADAVLA